MPLIEQGRNSHLPLRVLIVYDLPKEDGELLAPLAEHLAQLRNSCLWALLSPERHRQSILRLVKPWPLLQAVSHGAQAIIQQQLKYILALQWQ